MVGIRHFILLCAITLVVNAVAAVPPIINYQGKLLTAAGAPVADGAYAMTFAVYATPAGGTALWSEPNVTVQVKGGLYSVLLGSVVNLPANIFDAPERYFGVKVGADAELAPRQRIASVPFAMVAEKADTAATAAHAATADSATVAASANIAATVPDGAITAEKLAPGIGVPAGNVSIFAGVTAPTGYLLCRGQAVSRTEYARLFAAIGTIYGAGDGTTTFNLPNMQQRFPLGRAESGTGSILGSTGGLIDHIHRGYGAEGGDLRAAIGSCNGDAVLLGFLATHATDPDTGVGIGAPTYVVRGTSFSTGGSFNHYTPVVGHTGTANPPYLVVNYIIKY